MIWRTLWSTVRALPWSALHLVLFAALIGLRTSGAMVGRGQLGTYGLFVVLPTFVARTFEFGGARFRPERPPDSVIFAGTCLALAAGAFCLAGLDVVGAARQESDGFMKVVMPVWAWVGVAGIGAVLWQVPSAANWVRVCNQELAARLVKSETDLATARMQLLQSQMQPHFLFNALNTVTALLREDPTRGREVLLRLKALFERTLATSHNAMTTVGEEVALVRDQLSIEQERFRDRLHVAFDVDAALLAEPIPSFSLQPLAENALRHGIARSMSGGTIRVSVLSATDAGLRLVVEDTGAGVPPRWQEGTGLTNLRERLQAEYGSRATLTIGTAGDTTRAAIAIAPPQPASSRP